MQVQRWFRGGAEVRVRWCRGAGVAGAGPVEGDVQVQRRCRGGGEVQRR